MNSYAGFLSDLKYIREILEEFRYEYNDARTWAQIEHELNGCLFGWEFICNSENNNEEAAANQQCKVTGIYDGMTIKFTTGPSKYDAKRPILQNMLRRPDFTFTKE